MKTIDYIPDGFDLYRCANGKTYVAPNKCCLFCNNCSDILYDFTHGPYSWTCDLLYDPEIANNNNCPYFIKRDSPE